MSVTLYRRVETIRDSQGKLYAGIYYSMSGKSARIEIWTADTLAQGDKPFRAGRRLDTRRCSPGKARERARELVEFWGAVQP